MHLDGTRLVYERMASRSGNTTARWSASHRPYQGFLDSHDRFVLFAELYIVKIKSFGFAGRRWEKVFDAIPEESDGGPPPVLPRVEPRRNC
jgi:hypothetical protein